MHEIVLHHAEEYNTDPLVVTVAPGRFHLLGEHTWFAKGNTLSMAINNNLYLAVSQRSDMNYRLHSVSLGERKKISSSNLKYRREDRWANSVKVVISSFIEYGIHITGLNFTIFSEIPADAGLGTPNALKVATGLALRTLFAPKLTDATLVSLLERANTNFLKTHAHRADILCALFAKEGHCVKIDNRKISSELVAFPKEDYSIILTDSRVPRVLAREELAQRIQECIRAYEVVKESPDAPSDFNQLTEVQLEEISGIKESVRRRVVFIMRESERVHEAVNALKNHEYMLFSRTIIHSHEGLRDRFEISCPELDWLVKRAQEFIIPDAPDLVCSRMTGRGFGGCTYSILRTPDIESYKHKLDEYERIFGFKPMLYTVYPSDGAAVL
ncbi:galactokinase [Brucepastera parasyntrophica]|uniref:galactokinase n=1 Tax=Brucepastera parasyntrophica TaxID=2880008 RepID=UPI00210C60CF|nr:galactokinase [Brucepastera parasyntrophica]ULQ59782.1 galactokinase [Brucepastera parasyntrophica]